MNLKEKVTNLPSSPGVYLMKDSSDQIIYVGKAKNLKNRVRTYFQNTKAVPQKIKKLKANIKDFHFHLTDTEFEAFMLECKLIRELQPLFNKKMKNAHSYSYIRVYSVQGLWKMELSANREKNDDSLYFGPFSGKHFVETAIQGLKELLKVDCAGDSTRRIPCLNYSLGLCIGTCFKDSSYEQYNSRMMKIIHLLQGTDTGILEEINHRMNEASKGFQFETAAKYRDLHSTVSSLLYKEKMIEFTTSNQNIVLIEPLSESTWKLFLIKGKDVLFSKVYNIHEIKKSELLGAIKKEILDVFKHQDSHPLTEISKEDVDESQIIFSYIKNSGCSYFIVPDEWVKKESSAKLTEAIKSLFPKEIPLFKD
jgi:excinuclease ABC subunit C